MKKRGIISVVFAFLSIVIWFLVVLNSNFVMGFITSDVITADVITADVVSSSVRSGIIIDEGIHVEADEFNGATTDFLRLTNLQLASISNMVLENTTNGKINFSENVDLTAVVNNSLVDLDAYVEISHNSVYINTYYFTNLVKNAFVYIYNLNFSDEPVIVHNGFACGSSCSVLWYVNGTLKFSVEDFSGNYSANITAESIVTPPTSTGSPSSGGGGGAAPIVQINEDFNVSSNLLEYKIKKGDSLTKQITIKNLANKEYNILIGQENLNKFVSLKEESIKLKPFEEKTIDIKFNAPDSVNAEVYFGKIMLTSNYKKEIISVIGEIKEKNPLFDISVDIPELSKKVPACGIVYADINLENIGDILRTDTLLYYSIRDLNGKIINEKSETLSIERKGELTRSLSLPCETSKGQYIFYGRVYYSNQTAIAYDNFEVVSLLKSKMIVFALVAVLLIGAIITWFIIRKKIFVKKQKIEHKDIYKEKPKLITQPKPKVQIWWGDDR